MFILICSLRAGFPKLAFCTWWKNKVQTDPLVVVFFIWGQGKIILLILYFIACNYMDLTGKSNNVKMALVNTEK